MSVERKSYECDDCQNPTDNIMHRCDDCYEYDGSQRVQARKEKQRLIAELEKTKAELQAFKEGMDPEGAPDGDYWVELKVRDPFSLEFQFGSKIDGTWVIVHAGRGRYKNKDENLSSKDYAPDEIFKVLHLRDEVGLTEVDGEITSLAFMNDDDWTFTQIADFMEQNPELVFTNFSEAS